MKLADLMAEKGEEYGSEAPPGESFSVLRKRFLTGSDEEAQDAFRGMWALCEADEDEEGEATKPGLKIVVGQE